MIGNVVAITIVMNRTSTRSVFGNYEYSATSSAVPVTVAGLFAVSAPADPIHAGYTVAEINSGASSSTFDFDAENGPIRPKTGHAEFI